MMYPESDDETGNHGRRLARRRPQVPHHTSPGIEEKSIPTRTDEERDILVGSLACRSKRILSPGDDFLTDLVNGRELLTKPEQMFIGLKVEREDDLLYAGIIFHEPHREAQTAGPARQHHRDCRETLFCRTRSRNRTTRDPG